MSKRKDMRNNKSYSHSPYFFRAVVNNGNSRGLNLTEFLKEWQQVRIEIIEETDCSITLQLVDAEALT